MTAARALQQIRYLFTYVHHEIQTYCRAGDVTSRLLVPYDNNI